MPEPQAPRDLTNELLASIARTRFAEEVADVLGISSPQAARIIQAFDEFVAQPLRRNLSILTGRDLARRNPMIYTTRGITEVDAWVDRVLEDKETSAVEGLLGTWQEEVARIVSGGIKPGSGVDLQVDREGGVVELYAIQAAPNTKNSGSRRSDIEALKAAARPLRAARRTVEMRIAVLAGRSHTAPLKAEPEIEVLGSDTFWEHITGSSDFRTRLLRATVLLAQLVGARASAEVDRIREEATQLFGDGEGHLDLDLLSNPPRVPRRGRSVTPLTQRPKDVDS